MYVRHLQLGSFRSWERVDLALGPGPTVFVGRNGEGRPTSSRPSATWPR
ncbi:hypothetical protein [Blastococcus brunescens]|uniref:Rad50/SbcC-type AAA domain-containing protein n=1 Tax=Blastococcus brunescens TaxID=1564165 RepID=A0ABZ1B241_9ACTN|nr:hypothetical protein [Blastococcus sp. BMG 8361]WRL63811.1 hypothetical protein U6N30_29970 [Blastococcus sp. BMG 8361]